MLSWVYWHFLPLALHALASMDSLDSGASLASPDSVDTLGARESASGEAGRP